MYLVSTDDCFNGFFIDINTLISHKWCMSRDTRLESLGRYLMCTRTRCVHRNYILSVCTMLCCCVFSQLREYSMSQRLSSSCKVSFGKFVQEINGTLNCKLYSYFSFLPLFFFQVPLVIHFWPVASLLFCHIYTAHHSFNGVADFLSKCHGSHSLLQKMPPTSVSREAFASYWLCHPGKLL